MRLLVIPPPVPPDVFPDPRGCPDPDCGSCHVQFRQAVRNPLRDTHLHEFVAHRSQYGRCGRTFRVYPVGVRHTQTRARLTGLAVLWYVLGMSYGAAAIALAARLALEQGGRLRRGAGGWCGRGRDCGGRPCLMGAAGSPRGAAI